MNRPELVKAIAEKSGQSQSVVSEVLNSFISTVQDGVAAGEKITLVGFGTFESVKRAERQGRNPKTGEPLKIAASVLPKFTPGKAFKEQVNG